MADVLTPGASRLRAPPPPIDSKGVIPPASHARTLFFMLHMLLAAASSCHTLAALRLHHALTHAAGCTQVVDGREVIAPDYCRRLFGGTRRTYEIYAGTQPVAGSAIIGWGADAWHA
jgi:hypothetical protein